MPLILSNYSSVILSNEEYSAMKKAGQLSVQYLSELVIQKRELEKALRERDEALRHAAYWQSLYLGSYAPTYEAVV